MSCDRLLIERTLQSVRDLSALRQMSFKGKRGAENDQTANSRQPTAQNCLHVSQIGAQSD